MVTIVLDSMTVTTNKSSIFSFQLQMDIESHLHHFQRVYESRTLRFDGRVKRILIHEQFAVDVGLQALFLRTRLLIGPNSEQVVPKNYYLLYQPVDTAQTIVFDVAPDLKFELSYRIVTGVISNGTRSSLDDSYSLAEDSPSYIELMKIAKQFMVKVTPIRKLQWAVERELSRKDAQRDIFIVCSIILWCFVARYVLLALIFALMFRGPKTKFRTTVVSFMTSFFKKEEPNTEQNNNLIWIKKSMEMVNNLSETLRSFTLLSRNMRSFFIISKGLIKVLILLFFLHRFEFRYVVIIGSVAALLMKYQDELKTYFGCYSAPALQVERLFQRAHNWYRKTLKKLQKHKLTKFVFIRENESKSFGSFDKASLGLVCELISPATVF